MICRFVNYREALPKGISLCVYHGEKMIFSSGGKWLYPIFDFQSFIQKGHKFESEIPFAAHDGAVGKAALALLIYNKVRYIHGDLVSMPALDFMEKYNLSVEPEDRIILTYDKTVEHFRCATEAELAMTMDLEEMYRLIKIRYERAAAGK